MALNDGPINTFAINGENEPTDVAATAPTVTVSTPAAALLAGLATLAAAACVLTVSAPAADVQALASLAATAPTVAASAPSADLLQPGQIGGSAGVVTVSAPAMLVAPGAAAVTGTAAVVNVSASVAAVSSSRLTPTAASVAVSAPPATLSQAATTRVELLVQQVVREGVLPSYSSAPIGGHALPNSGAEFVHIKTGSSGVVVTFQTPGMVDELPVDDRIEAIGPNSSQIFGVFPPSIYNQADDHVYIDFDTVVGVTIGAFRVS
jgi:hypothetical protein